MTENSKIKKFLKKVRGVVLYFLVVAALVYIIPMALSWILQTKYPMAAITSNSMWPTLKKGDLVLIKGVSKNEITVGDIVVFVNEKNAFTIHRVVELGEETLVTKGDANAVRDEAVRYEDVVGRLLRVGSWNVRIPKLGFISMLVGKRR